jgi:hypothetical protein
MLRADRLVGWMAGTVLADADSRRRGAWSGPGTCAHAVNTSPYAIIADPSAGHALKPPGPSYSTYALVQTRT